MAAAEDPVFVLGLDLSTQSATGVIASTTPVGGSVRESAAAATTVSVAAEESINFDAALPQYGTSHGVHHRRVPSDDGGETVTSPVAMWVDALEQLFATLRNKHGLLLSRVRAISVSAQQHATVLVADPSAFLQAVNEDPSAPLSPRLLPTLASPNARVWMDASTETDRQRFLAHVNEAANKSPAEDTVRAITGARAELRYVASQLMGLERLTPGLVSERTARVHLCSAMVASLLAGVDAPVDRGDAAGTNLFDLRSMRWSSELIKCTGLSSLAASLGPTPVPAGTVLSRDRPPSRWCTRMLGGPEAPVAIVSGSGDNPCSLVGCFAADPTEAAVSVSLGTSDTVCAPIARYQPQSTAALPTARRSVLADLVAEPCTMGNRG